MRVTYFLAWISTFLGAIACRSSEAVHANWADPVPQAPAPIVTWSGYDSERGEPGFFALTSASDFDSMWLDVIVRHGSSRWPTDHLHPRVDFTHCVGFAWAAGQTWNTRGYELKSVERIGANWHARIAPVTYQSHGEGDRVTPYVVVLFTRVPGATIVVEEDVRDLIDAPPEWKERGRVVTPKIARALVPVAPPETESFAPAVLAAVRGYARWQRLSDLPAWSPFDCRGPPAAGAFVSASDDGNSHGSKLYHLFVKDAAAYDARGVDGAVGADQGSRPSRPSSPAPVGQVIVKEAWHAVPVELPPRGADGQLAVPEEARAKAWVGLAADHATRSGKLYRKGEQAELFVMLKLDPATPDTDRGWVYATVTPDMQRVLAAGRIQNCMSCHARAEHDRQFGIAEGWAAMREVPR